MLAASDAGGADEDRLAQFMARLDVVDDRVELRLLALEDEVGLVDALLGTVGGDRHDAEPVDVFISSAASVVAVPVMPAQFFRHVK